MKTRKLGKSGPTVSALGLGCMGMSGVYGKYDEKQAIQTIHQALDLEINFLDTADAYGNGHNEQLIGKAIADRRDKVFIATKFGLQVAGKDGNSMQVNGRPEYVRQACDASLKRLGVDVIDLYYQHRVDPDTPVEETVGAMALLVKEGKIRYLGLSEASAKTIQRANAIHKITALQSEYSLWSRDVEAEILPACNESGIGLVAWSPLGRGFLTGRIRSAENFEKNDYRNNSPRFQGANFEANLKLVKQLEKIANERRCTPSQLALAWLLSQGEHVVPIPGTKQIKYLEENRKATDVKISPEELQHINNLFHAGRVAGQRYPEALLKMVNL